MKTTLATEYGLRAIMHMATAPEKSFSALELYGAVGAPRKYLGKILQKLTKSKILRSTRGVNGGFVFNVRLQDLTIVDIIEAVDGPMALNKCLLTGHRCPRKGRCPIHDLWREGQAALVQVFASRNFGELAEEFMKRQ